MLKKILLSVMCLFLQNMYSQEADKPLNGMLQIGLRTTLSIFNPENPAGMGSGGHFRIGLGTKLNTEWFFDYIKSNENGVFNRNDYHIGWTVQYFPFGYTFVPNKISPYIAAGHCFDYTRVSLTAPFNNDALDRWTSAVSSGIGTHFHLSKNMNISLNAIYMIHLGTEILVEKQYWPYHLKEVPAGIEGHLLLTLSTNILIGNLWKKQ